MLCCEKWPKLRPVHEANVAGGGNFSKCHYHNLKIFYTLLISYLIAPCKLFAIVLSVYILLSRLICEASLLLLPPAEQLAKYAFGLVWQG